MSSQELRAILGRKEMPLPLPDLKGARVVVTGAAGSLGQVLVPLLDDLGAKVIATDIGDLDVRRGRDVERFLSRYLPGYVLHLAAMKYAPDGEIDPLDTVETNVVGTANVLEGVWTVGGVRVVTVSTCKAIEPETVYGASKLVAERLTLNFHGRVARLYNTIQSAGNVFEKWAEMPNPVPATPCLRYFMSALEAASLILTAAVAASGRYVFNPGPERSMPTVAEALGRSWYLTEPRRGDRLAEPLCGEHETFEHLSGPLYRVDGAHDRAKLWPVAA